MCLSGVSGSTPGVVLCRAQSAELLKTDLGGVWPTSFDPKSAATRRHYISSLIHSTLSTPTSPHTPSFISTPASI